MILWERVCLKALAFVAGVSALGLFAEGVHMLTFVSHPMHPALFLGPCAIVGSVGVALMSKDCWQFRGPLAPVETERHHLTGTTGGVSGCVSGGEHAYGDSYLVRIDVTPIMDRERTILCFYQVECLRLGCDASKSVSQTWTEFEPPDEIDITPIG